MVPLLAEPRRMPESALRRALRGRVPWPTDCESGGCAGIAQAGAARNRDDLGSTGAFASSPSVGWREQVKALCFCLRAENTLLVDAGCYVLLDCQRYD